MPRDFQPQGSSASTVPIKQRHRPAKALHDCDCPLATYCSWDQFREERAPTAAFFAV